MIVCEALERTLDPAIAQLIAFLCINVDLIIGPLVFLFARSITHPELAFGRRDLRHFVPAIVGFIGWLVAWTQIRHLPGGGLHSVALLPFFVATKALVFFSYVSATYRLLGSERPKPLRPIHMDARKRLPANEWLRRGLVIASGAVGIIYAIAILDALKIDTRVEPDLVGSVLLASFIFLTSLMITARPSLLSSTRNAQPGSAAYDSALRLLDSLENDRPWLDPQFGLGNLAKTMGIGENRVSALINQELGTNFYSLLNGYRLREFERLASDPECQSKSVIELALESGFSSKASFYRIFREHHRMTPTAYRKSRIKD